MISHELRFIFIHIPKCAGTSVESHFGHILDKSKRGYQDHRTIRMLQTPIPLVRAFATPDNRFCLAKRLYHRLRAHNNPRNQRTVDAEQYSKYFKFAIVRDPWSRSYSWYRNVVRDPIHRQKYGVKETILFVDFLERFGGRGMMAPIDFWLQEFDGRVRMDRIIRFEAITAEFPELCRTLGVRPTALPRENQGGSSADLAAALDERARKLVASLYHEEIATYGFTCPA